MPNPLIEWYPRAGENLMILLGSGKFKRIIDLAKGAEYQFKLVDNQSNWQIVTGDCELDGYG